MKPIDTFQNRLEKALTTSNMKPVELHEKTGISESLISKYLSGNAIARQKKLTLIADVLNVNEVWLMGYDVAMNKTNWSKFNNIINVEKLKADVKKYEELEKILGRPLTIEDVEFVKDIDVNGLTKEQKEDLKKQIEYMHWQNENKKEI